MVERITSRRLTLRTLPVSRRSNLPRPWAQRMCAGCTPGSRRTGQRSARSTEADGERGCAGHPLHKICTASLDNGPLIDGFDFFAEIKPLRLKSLSDNLLHI